jgi:unsaturated rhamnogalacturonyl hydrolase
MLCLSLLTALLLRAQQSPQVSTTLPWSVRMTQSEMIRNPESWQLDFQPQLKWDYCHGLELQAMLDVYDRYGDEKIYRYALAYADTMVNVDGSIKKYRVEEYSLDRVNPGKFLFRIYEQTKEDKYRIALALLRSQLDTHPRNADGGFWHKQVYPNQVWLDGVYMGAPFYAEYAYRNDRVNDYQDVIFQFLMAARHTYDAKNNLFRHACDVSRKEQWADPVTGQSQHSWGRAMGWYAMAFVDALDFIPKHEAGRDSMLTVFNSLAEMIKQRQDEKSGVWYQVLDRSGDADNYLESSCSAMFTYALFKGVRKGYLNRSYLTTAIKGYQGIMKQFIEVDDNGLVSITRACAVAGLGGKNYRMGDYNYYINEPIRTNDAKAVAPFILASLEWEQLQEDERIISVKQAAVQSGYKSRLVVARDGTGDYRSLTEAMDGIRASMDYTVTVHIKKGVYKEKVVIPAWLNNVVIEGEDADHTIITYDDHANINNMGTFRTYTVRVDGNNITFRNLTI